MTANGRPNLGGLFTGSTPPEQSSTIADALDPRAGASESTGAGTRSTGTGSAETRRPRPRDTGTRVTPVPAAASSVETSQPGSTPWWDPVNALGHYFDILQRLFDANRAVTMAVATAVTAPLRRSGR